MAYRTASDVTGTFDCHVRFVAEASVENIHTPTSQAQDGLDGTLPSPRWR